MMQAWHTSPTAAPIVERAKDYLARIEAVLETNPINASRFRTLRAELRTALRESESYLRWTLADWGAVIRLELEWAERRMAERLAA